MNDGGRRTERDSITGPQRGGERRPGLRAAGQAAMRIAAPIVGRHGGVLARIKAEWATAVGAELAAITWPESLGRDGALKLRVRPGFALEVQHCAPLVIERVNLYFGRAAVARLALLQGELPLAAPPRRAPSPPVKAGEEGALAERLAVIADPALREALASLGRLVLAGAPDGPEPTVAPRRETD
jgi:hypothetical protein